jgi:hypothetical protein
MAEPISSCRAVERLVAGISSSENVLLLDRGEWAYGVARGHGGHTYRILLGQVLELHKSSSRKLRQTGCRAEVERGAKKRASRRSVRANRASSARLG